MFSKKFFFIILLSSFILLIVILLIFYISRSKRPKFSHNEEKKLLINQQKQSNIVLLDKPISFKNQLKEIEKDDISKTLVKSGKNNLLEARKIIYSILSHRQPVKIPNTPNITLYPGVIFCSNNQCQPQAGDKQVSLLVSIINGLYGVKSGDKSSINLAKKDIFTLKNHRYQLIFLHCFFIKDLLDETDAFSELKEDLVHICQNSDRIKKNNIDRLITNQINLPPFNSEEEIKKLRKEIILNSNLSSYYPNDSFEEIAYFSYPLDYVSEYFLTNSINSLFFSRGYLDILIDYLSKADLNDYNNFIGPSLLPATGFFLAQATDEKEYYNFAYQSTIFFTQKYRNNLQNLLYSALADGIAYSYTGEKYFKEDLDQIITYIEKNYMISLPSGEKYLARFKNKDKKFVYVEDNIVYSYLKIKFQ